MKRAAARIASFHRVLLVVSSIAIGVAGSRVASDPTEWPSWAIVAASGCLLFVADVGRRLDDDGRTLSVATHTPLGAARRDAASTPQTRAIAVGSVLTAAFILVAIAFVVFDWPST